MVGLEVELDGHSILVTPDPVPNSEVKRDYVRVCTVFDGKARSCLFIFLNSLSCFAKLKLFLFHAKSESLRLPRFRMISCFA